MINIDLFKFCTDIESAIRPHGWHCGLTGSCLYGMGTGKDIDIILYPHNTKSIPQEQLGVVLKTLGFNLSMDVPSNYARYVVISKYKDIRVDLIFFYCPGAH